MTATAARTEYRIRQDSLPRVEEKFADLAKRAAKLGCEAPTYTVVRSADEPNEYGFVERVAYVTVQGEAPRLEGWAIVAILDHKTTTGTLVKAISERYLVPEQYQEADADCDHCGYRRKRNDTFLLRHEDGQWAQVGRNCLEDFVGNDPLEAIRLADEYASINLFFSEHGHGSSWSSPYLRAKRYLATVAKVIETYGWLSRGAAWDQGREGQASADVALEWQTIAAKTLDDQKRRKLSPETSHYEQAENAIAWCRDELAAKSHHSDYEHNLVTVIADDVIHVDNVGIAASLLPVHKRELERKARQQFNGDASEWIGEEGDRLDFGTVTVLSDYSFEGYYGLTTIFKFADADGNLLTWFTSSSQDIEPGDVVELRGTIKEHKTYKGKKETQLTRCRVS